jgi:hypothetical protein
MGDERLAGVASVSRSYRKHPGSRDVRQWPVRDLRELGWNREILAATEVMGFQRQGGMNGKREAPKNWTVPAGVVFEMGQEEIEIATGSVGADRGQCEDHRRAVHALYPPDISAKPARVHSFQTRFLFSSREKMSDAAYIPT